MENSRSKIYVVDTSVLAHDDRAIEMLEDNEIVLHGVVLEELDRLRKNKYDEVGQTAQAVIRRLDAYRKRGSLNGGVKTDAGGLLRVKFTNKDDFSRLPVVFERTNDNRIILLALMLKEELKKEYDAREVIVVSKDINFRVKAEACGITAEDYKFDKEAPYDGTKTINLLSEEKHDIFGILHQEGQISAERVFLAADGRIDLDPNTCCFLERHGDHRTTQTLAIYKKTDDVFMLVSKKEMRPQNGKIFPKNAEQLFAYFLLKDPSVELVTIVGKAGSGKTLMSLLAGYQQIQTLDEGIKEKMFDQMLVFRYHIEMGRGLGFLPGDKDEKFQPWKQPILDNLQLFLRDKEAERKSGYDGGREKLRHYQDLSHFVQTGGLIEVSPISYLRGRSLHRKFILVDDAQNLSRHQIKTIITRAGEGTKVVLVGDSDQIDDRFLNAESNGLAHVRRRFRGQKSYAHITMKKTERSALAELGATLL